MRPKKNYVIRLFLALFILNGLITTGKVKAASATITIAALSDNIQVGDTFSVSVLLTSAATIGEVSQTIQYDTDILQFVTETSIYEEEDGKITITDKDPSESSQKYILQFKAVKEGTAKVKVTGTPMIYSTDGSVLSFSKNVASVTVGAKKEKSTNRNLASLSVKEGALDETFKKNQTEYTMSVGQDVKSLTITAKPEHSGAKVEVNGADKLLVGDNTVTIKVTSETNQSKEYKILVTRGIIAPADEAVQPEQSNTPQGAQDSQETVEQEASPVTEEASKTDQRVVVKEGILSVKGTMQYELLTLDNLRLLPKGYLSVSLSIDGQAVDAYQLENGKDKEVYLVYARPLEGSAAFYLYDSKEQTMQRYIENTRNITEDLGVISIEAYHEKVKSLSTMVGVCVSLVILLAATAFHYYKKSKDR